MEAIYQNSSDILNLILTIGWGVTFFLLVVVLIYIINILSNFKKITNKAKDTVDLVNHYLWQPIKIMMSIIEKSKEYTNNKSKKNKEK